MTIPERMPVISWEADSLCHCCLLCSGMSGYHPLSTYDVTIGTKKAGRYLGNTKPVGCPVRLVLGDSRLGSSVVFLKTTLPCSFYINGRPSFHALGLREKCRLI